MDNQEDARPARLSREVLQPVARALHHGATHEEQNRIIAEAAILAGQTEPDVTEAEIRKAALGAIISEPVLHQSVAYLDEWLEGQTSLEAAVELATGWSLAATGLDLAKAAEEARLYIDAYPFEGRIIGDLAEKAALWLAQRLAMVQADPAERLPSVRRSIKSLSEAAAPEFPAAAASIQEVATELPDERLWYELALRITQRELVSSFGG